MKPNRLTFVILLIVTCILLLQAGCEEEVAQPQELSPDWFKRFPQPAEWTTTSAAHPSSLKVARIAFEKVVHNFGTIGPETANLCTFNFKNTGDGILKIEEVTKTCGCTPYALNKTEYAPGESGTLQVNYITDTQLGPTTQELTVVTNDIENPEVTLAVKATVTSKIDYEPKIFNLALRGENAGCPPLTISSMDNQPFSITYIQSTANCITVDFDPSVKATSFELQPKVDMTRLETVLNGTVEIGLTHPDSKKITVAMKTLPRYQMSPSSITIRRATPKTVYRQKVRILNNYGEPFNLENATSKNGSIRVVKNTIIPDRGYELELEITPPVIESRSKLFAEEFSLGLSSGLQLKVPCYVFYSGAKPKATLANQDDCPTCGAKIIDPKTGKVTAFGKPK
jgi:hypothetical protein